jgi:hypothetical protein
MPLSYGLRLSVEGLVVGGLELRGTGGLDHHAVITGEQRDCCTSW